MNLVCVRSKCLCKERKASKSRIGFDNMCGFGACGLDHFQIFNGFHAKIRYTPLLATIQLAGTALDEIRFGQFESILCSLESLQSVECLLTRGLGKDEAVRLMRAAQYATA